MTTTSIQRGRAGRRDRWADLAVIVLALVALGLGAILRHAVLFSTTAFEVAEASVSGAVPNRWVWQRAEDPLLRARNPRTGAFPTALELRSRPLAEDAELAFVLDALALERAAGVDAYQALGTEQVWVEGQVALQRNFTYVHVDRSPYVRRLPDVVRGVDLAMRDEGRVVIVTYVALADSFDEDYIYFRRFVEDLQF